MFLFVSLLACAVRGPAADVRGLLREDHDVEAAALALTALRTRPSPSLERQARRAVERALIAHLDQVTMLRAAGRPLEALEELSAGEALLARAGARGLMGLETPDLAALRVEVQADAATLHADLARQAVAEARWGAAVAHLEIVRRLASADDAAGTALASAWTSWAGETSDPRLASERLVAAANASGAAADRAAAAASVDALGHEALARGACRRAAIDLARAIELDPTAGAELAAAQACARTAMSVDVTLAVHPALGPTPPSRTIPGPDGPIPTGPYRLELRVESVRYQSGVTERAVRRQRVDTPCDPRVATCPRDVVAVVEVFTERTSGVLVGRLQVVDVAHDGHVVVSAPIRVTASDDAAWPGRTLQIEETRASAYGTELLVRPGGAAPPRGGAEAARVAAQGRVQDRLSEAAVRAAVPVALAAVDGEPEALGY